MAKSNVVLIKAETPSIAFAEFEGTFEGFSETSNVVMRRAIANSCVYRAAFNIFESNVANAILQPTADQAERRDRLLREAALYGELYAYYSVECKTHNPSDKYSQPMTIEDTMALLLKSEPRAPDALSDEELAFVGASREEMVLIDAAAALKAAALNQRRIDTMYDMAPHIIAEVNALTALSAKADPPANLPVSIAHGLLSKVAEKLATERTKILANRRYIPTWASDCGFIAQDLPGIEAAIRKIERDYAGDDRVRLTK